MENNTLLNEVIERAQGWLTGNYNAETKADVQRMIDAEATDIN